MLKLLKNKFIIIFEIFFLVIIIGISVKTLFMIHTQHTTIGKSQVFNIKESYIKNINTPLQNVNENNVNKEINLLSDEKILNENIENNNINKNNQKDINSKSEKVSSNNYTKKQEINNPNIEKSSNNDTNKQTSTSSFKIDNTNSNVNKKNNGSTNTASEVKKSTIYYDRTTSIYANDNATLLRIEYYVNNKLTYYSVVEKFDVATKSYVEKIYKCNRSTNIDPLVRTDEYVNGNLIKSY